MGAASTTEEMQIIHKTLHHELKAILVALGLCTGYTGCGKRQIFRKYARKAGRRG
jgi:hypothetical protein